MERLAKILGVESYKLFSVDDETNEPLERLHQSIINDVRIIVKEAVNEIKIEKDARKGEIMLYFRRFPLYNTRV